VISFFGPSLLPLEITDGGLQEDHRIFEPPEPAIAVIAKKAANRPVFVVVVNGEFATRAVTTPVTVQTTANGTAAVLLFQQLLVLFDGGTLLCQSEGLVGSRQTRTALVLSADKCRKLVQRFPDMAAAAFRAAFTHVLVAGAVGSTSNEMPAHAIKSAPRLSSNLPD